MAEDPELPAGVPSRGDTLFRVGCIGGSALLLVGVLVFKLCNSPLYGSRLGRIPLSGFGQTAGIDLRVAPGHTLKFVVSADSVKWSGYNTFVLDLHGFSDAGEVATINCHTGRLRNSGSSTGSMYQSDECNMKVPAGGLTKLRASVGLANPTPVTATGLALEIVGD